MQKHKYFLIFLPVLVILLFSIVYAANGIGTSSISLTSYSVNLTGGQSANIGFTISLASGNTWGTYINISPANSPISIIANPSEGDPTFSGNLIISVPKNITPGSYTFYISAYGDDPSISSVKLVVNVLNSPSIVSTTSTSNSSTTSVNKTTPISSNSVTSTPKSSSSTLSYSVSNYFVYVGTIFAILVVLLIVFALTQKTFYDFSKYGLIISTAIALASSLYLLLFDTLLRNTAPLHYAILLAYFVLLIGLVYVIYKVKKQSKLSSLVLGIISALFVLGMFLDAILGLPFSSLSGTASAAFNYLFGFGAKGTSSSFGESLAFSLLLLSSASISIQSIFRYLRHK
ncbi:MAG: hypothetical protein QXX36_03330 [Candidatus Rehaiarchaeum fermentans]|nr:hypothetical protein [Candidatus Rehaiarchaeum fermentans]